MVAISAMFEVSENLTALLPCWLAEGGGKQRFQDPDGWSLSVESSTPLHSEKNPNALDPTNTLS